MKKLVRLFLLLFVVFSFGFSEGRDPREEKLSYLIGEKIDNFEVKTLDGTKTITLEELRGKKVFLNFTTTWCPDCIEEKKIFNEEYEKKYKDRNDMVFITVFGPYKTDNKSKVKEYMEKNKYTFEPYYDTEEKELLRKFGVINIPATFFINEYGVLEDVNIESGYKNIHYFK
ncbi:MAG: TlpA family protein disulfide reductase [Cetobacterium sp.]|uniref:TlpA family protein disulfide reductase n=1 Tax=Cetobacterium sp. TaxID=2071632 RepID=UPI003F39C15A